MSETRVVIGALEEFTERVMTRLSVNITAELIEDTPVRTGWARANWVPTIGRPFNVNVGRGPGEDENSTQVNRANARQTRGQTELLGYRIEQGRIFISNNVPYIQALNAGSSDKAPAMFVQAGIQAGVRFTAGSVRA